MVKKIQLEPEEWSMLLGDMAQVRDGILQAARPHELRDGDCSLAKNIMARDAVMAKIQELLQPDDKAKTK